MAVPAAARAALLLCLAGACNPRAGQEVDITLSPAEATVETGGAPKSARFTARTAGGEDVSASCAWSVDDSALGGAVTTELDVEYLAPREITVDKRRVAVERQRWTQKLVGERSGTLVEEWWFDRSSGMPVRASRRYQLETSTPIGRVGYRETGSWSLASLDPS